MRGKYHRLKDTGGERWICANSLVPHTVYTSRTCLIDLKFSPYLHSAEKQPPCVNLILGKFASTFEVAVKVQKNTTHFVQNLPAVSIFVRFASEAKRNNPHSLRSYSYEYTTFLNNNQESQSAGKPYLTFSTKN